MASACNENVIKNMANEITRNCQTHNVSVEPEFVVYLIDLLLLNPKYGKLFSRTINRNNLAFFVDECVTKLVRGETPISTLKMQFIMQSNYDKIQNLIDSHMNTITNCLQPLVNEILDEDPEPTEEAEFKKLFRKISIYIILASGLGNPGIIATLKEGMAALQSVFSLDDLRMFVAMPRTEKVGQLNDLVEVVSGVRLFNRDCKKGGEGIPDLPFNLVDAGKACLTSLSNSLISVMQRVNTLTTAVEDAIVIQDETGNVEVRPCSPEISLDDYEYMFDLLAFHRQYEVLIRKLLCDCERAVQGGAAAVDRCRRLLEDTHHAVKYKAAVPVLTVFPLFTKLWQVWRSMQHVMYVVSRVSRLMSALAATHDQVPLPRDLLDAMLCGKTVISDQDRMSTKVSMEERLGLGTLKDYVTYTDEFLSAKDRQLAFLGFCTMCLTVGALVPSNLKVGVFKCGTKCYSFCNVRMAAKFGKDPKRYINEALEFARNNPQVINLLNIMQDVIKVKDIDNLVTKHVPKTKVLDKDIQTDTHPIEEYIEKNYSWDLWEWKRRACQWASIVNCQTHSTQTHYSHLRSDVYSQTYELRDKSLQTKKDKGINTLSDKVFIWGLRGQIGDGQHYMDMGEKHSPDKKKANAVTFCSWPCIESKQLTGGKSEEPKLIDNSLDETMAAIDFNIGE